MFKNVVFLFNFNLRRNYCQYYFNAVFLFSPPAVNQFKGTFHIKQLLVIVRKRYLIMACALVHKNINILPFILLRSQTFQKSALVKANM